MRSTYWEKATASSTRDYPVHKLQRRGGATGEDVPKEEAIAVHDGVLTKSCDRTLSSPARIVQVQTNKICDFLLLEAILVAQKVTSPWNFVAPTPTEGGQGLSG